MVWDAGGKRLPFRGSFGSSAVKEKLREKRLCYNSSLNIFLFWSGTVQHEPPLNCKQSYKTGISIKPCYRGREGGVYGGLNMSSFILLAKICIIFCIFFCIFFIDMIRVIHSGSKTRLKYKSNLNLNIQSLSST